MIYKNIKIMKQFLNDDGKLKHEFKDYMEKHFTKLVIKQDIEYKRTQKLRKYLSKNNFENLIGRIIREHDDSYIDKCYKNGYQPRPNNKFSLLLSLVEIEGDEIKEIDFKNDTFPNVVIKYENYYFQWIWGQGVITRIYDIRHELILQL